MTDMQRDRRRRPPRRQRRRIVLTEPVLVDERGASRTLDKCRDIGAAAHGSANLHGHPRAVMEVMPVRPAGRRSFDTAFHQHNAREGVSLRSCPMSMYRKIQDPPLRLPRHVAPLCVGKGRGDASASGAARYENRHLPPRQRLLDLRGQGRQVSSTRAWASPRWRASSWATRCGSIDPAIVPFIMEKENIPASEMGNFMNKQCGLLGVSEVSSDLRDVMAAVRAGNKQARLAFDILCYGIKKVHRLLRGGDERAGLRRVHRRHRREHARGPRRRAGGDGLPRHPRRPREKRQRQELPALRHLRRRQPRARVRHPDQRGAGHRLGYRKAGLRA